MAFISEPAQASANSRICSSLPARLAVTYMPLTSGVSAAGAGVSAGEGSGSGAGVGVGVGDGSGEGDGAGAGDNVGSGEASPACSFTNGCSSDGAPFPAQEAKSDKNKTNTIKTKTLFSVLTKPPRPPFVSQV